MNLAEKILKFRAKKKLSQKQFADMCGISNMTVYRIENGGKTRKCTETLIRMKIEEMEGI